MRKIVLRKAKRVNSEEFVIGYLTKMWGAFHIISLDDENTAYPIEEDSIEPVLGDDIWYMKRISLKKYE